MRFLEPGSRHRIRFTLNGRSVSGEAEPRLLFTDFLRHALGYTGTHVGCEHGMCGACTVLVDGKAMRACLLYAVQLDGRDVRTIEGLASKNGALNDLQTAFRKHHALQCGFCTPGILMTLTQLLDEEPGADETRIRDVLSGHLCRCTGYHGIVAAALEVSKARQTAAKA
jgi:aerobic-type carbon monoxide dehydrogenase small subunit (CoxS/CutS family)